MGLEDREETFKRKARYNSGKNFGENKNKNKNRNDYKDKDKDKNLANVHIAHEINDNLNEINSPTSVVVKVKTNNRIQMYHIYMISVM